MSSIKTLYHGSVEIIKKPEFGKGNCRNDYGLGFYCTEDLELAKEWACATNLGGFANVYTIDTSELSILDLSAPEYGIMEWLSVLVNNRVFQKKGQVATDAAEYLTKYFLPDINQYGVIIGYRADDSYFTFAQDFLNNAINLRQLSRAMYFGKLGKQFVLRSRKAFDLIRFTDSISADGEVYHIKRIKRDKEARDAYLGSERRITGASGELYMIDILRGEMKPGDERLQRILFE